MVSLPDDRRAQRGGSWRSLVIPTAIGGLGLAVGFLINRLRTLEARGQSEQEAAALAAEALRQRNSQLTALYNVFSEITQTLTLRYVVDTTLRETQQIMTADMVVLRKLEGDQLVAIGAMAGGGIEITGLQVVAIDSNGPTGRAARTGRSVRLDRDGEVTMGRNDASAPGSPSSQTGRAPLESGVITPLIVGARVVGTMACWSLEKIHFTSEDERLLEMMASSVATAIVASESVENSSRQAHIDPLTDLPNRRQLNEDLRGVLANLSATTPNAVIAMADIDHFKRFNDDFGHKVGDITLQAVASVLLKEKRETDFLYRYGGEEFVMIFAGANPDEALALAERVRAAVEATHLAVEGHPQAGPVTISVGLACLPLHGARVADLIELADIAMYQSKATGRNQVTVWQPGSEGERVA
jgi:diguanylate cyclase (GGDEF)-like protein